MDGLGRSSKVSNDLAVRRCTTLNLMKKPVTVALRQPESKFKCGKKPNNRSSIHDQKIIQLPDEEYGTSCGIKQAKERLRVPDAQRRPDYDGAAKKVGKKDVQWLKCRKGRELT